MSQQKPGQTSPQRRFEDALRRSGMTGKTFSDLGPYPPTGISAASFFGKTKEDQVSRAIARAKLIGVTTVFVPLSMLPLNMANVVTDPTVTIVYEGSNTTKVYASSLPGADAGVKLALAFTIVATLGGGTVDATGFVGAQQINQDIFGGFVGEVPVSFDFGAATFTVSSRQFVPSYITFNLNQTTFKLLDGTAAIVMWDLDTKCGAGSAIVTNGSNTITLNGGGFNNGVTAQPGRVIGIFGQLAVHGGRDGGTLTSGIDNSQTTIPVSSQGGVTNFTNYIVIDNEIMRVTAYNAPNFTVVRGDRGTTAVTHSNGAAFNRVTYNNYIIRTVAGNVLTLDDNYTGPTATSMDVFSGPVRVAFRGTGLMDGNKGATDSTNNAGCIQGRGCMGAVVERGIRFQNWDHTGVFFRQSQWCVVDGFYYGIGWPDTQLGFSVSFFEGSKYCTALGDYENCNSAASCDDRTTNPTFYDNACVGCIVMPRTIRNVWRGGTIEGCIDCFVYLPYVENWNQGILGGGVVLALGSPQWVTTPTTDNNRIIIGEVKPVAGTAWTMLATMTNSTLISYTPGLTGTVPNPGLGNVVEYVQADGTRRVSGAGVKYEGQSMFGSIQDIDNATLVNIGSGTVSSTIAAALTNTIQRAVMADMASNSAATSRTTGMEARARTAAAAYTCTVLAGYYALTAIQGAGSTITNDYGFFAEVRDKGANENVAFCSQANASATGALTAGVKVKALSGAATVNAGIDVDNVSGAGTNYAIRTGTGKVQFGDDMDATGGFRQTVDGWFQENVSISQTNVALTRLATTTEVPTRWIAIRAGSVTGVNVKSNAARTNGTLTIKVFNNGSQLGSLTAVLDGTNTTFKASTQAKDTSTFVAGDELELTITTDASWAPTTADIRASLEVET